MATSRSQKETILKELTENFQNAKSVVFADYRGLTVKQMTDLRGNLRKEKNTLTVAKKTLLKLAAKNALKLKLPDENIEGAICATFALEDALASPRIIHEFSKKADKLKIISGMMDGELISADQVKELAIIPSKEVLIAKMLGSMQSPISGFVRVLHANIQGLHTVFSAIRDQKST